jgi:hypothetical protein
MTEAITAQDSGENMRTLRGMHYQGTARSVDYVAYYKQRIIHGSRIVGMHG